MTDSDKAILFAALSMFLSGLSIGLLIAKYLNGATP